jgi:hypothetical protein
MSQSSWIDPKCSDPREKINNFIKENPIRTKTFQSQGWLKQPSIEDKKNEYIETLKFKDDVVKIKNFVCQEEIKLEYAAYKYEELIKNKQKVK